VPAVSWTVVDGPFMPTMKLKRAKVVEAHKQDFEKLYAGH
jgi:long-subunit acyl-CoA synthetase (AMP-forming)